MILTAKHELPWTDEEPQTKAKNAYVCADRLEISIVARPKAAPRWKSRKAGERALRYVLPGVLHNGGALPGSASYTYDAAGNRLTKTAVQEASPNPVSVLSQFSYDNIYELTQAVVNGTVAEGYTYDAVGNRLTSAGPVTYNNNASNELTSTSAATYTYDNNGNTTSKTTTAGTTSYAWDFENRLASLTLPGTGGTVNFKYDPFGRRIEKIAPTSGTTVYAYDGDNVTEQLGSGGNLLAHYTQGAGIDEPLAITGTGGTYFSHADGLGSLTALTGGSGQLANSYVYDSFGNLTASSGTVANPFQFTGWEFDAETGLFYYRARHYDPGAGRFFSEDPTRWGSGNVNFYVYVFNNPALLFDPFGLSCACTFSISTGHFQCSGPNPKSGPWFIDTFGYSGYGYAKNNLAETDLPGIVRNGAVVQGGPIPMGTWIFGEGYPGHAGNPQFDLTATSDVSIPPRRHGVKGSFMIHADTNPTGNASAGCIILPLSDRQKLAQCQGGTLWVTP